MARDRVAADVAGATGVEHVEQAVVDGQADRPIASGGVGVDQLEAVPPDLEARDRVTARIDGEQATAVQRQCALVAEPGAGPGAAGGELAPRGQRAVAVALEDLDRVAGRVVGQGVDGARRVRHRAGRGDAERCQRQRQRDRQRNARRAWEKGGHVVPPGVGRRVAGDARRATFQDPFGDRGGGSRTSAPGLAARRHIIDAEGR